MRSVLLGATLAGMIACGAARPSPSAVPMAPLNDAAGATPSIMAVDPHAQIEALEHDITERGGTFVVQLTASTNAVPMDEAPKSTDASCHPAPTPTCTDACKLSDAICDDAKKICDIAVTIPADTWAMGKCDSGKASCLTAHETCCSCR